MLKSAWACKNGKQILKKSIQTVKELDRIELAKIQSTLPERKQQRKNTENEKQKAFDVFWGKLTVGFDLSRYGIFAVVKKKNAKSILTEGGKWTKKELFLAI